MNDEVEMQNLEENYEKLKSICKSLLAYRDQADEIIHKHGCKYPCTCGLSKLLADLRFSNLSAKRK